MMQDAKPLSGRVAIVTGGGREAAKAARDDAGSPT